MNREPESLLVARSRVRSAKRTVALFLIFGVAWIVITGTASYLLFEDKEPLIAFEIMKGILFTVLASLIIYLSIARHAETVLTSEITSLERFRNTVEQSAVGIVHADLEGRYLWANSRFAEIVGRTIEDLIGRSFHEITHPDDISTDLDFLNRISTGEIAEFSTEKRYVHPDGQSVWVLVTITGVRDDEGALSYYSGIVQDISARKAAEEALRSREEEYRVIVETMGQGIYTLDRDNHVTYVNRRMCEIVGYERNEMIGAGIIELLAFPEDRDSIETMSRRRLEGLSDRYDSRMRHASGAEILIVIDCIPRFDAAGHVVGKVCVVTDVTGDKEAANERERLEVQIEQINRIESLGKLAGTMAHEFNNVLMGIQPFVDVINRSVNQDDTRVRKATSFIIDAVNRGRRVSQEVLRFARPSPPARRTVNARDLVTDVAQVGRGIVRSKHSLETSSDSSDEVAVDREQIIQVFTNLLLNAMDAMPDGGRISIRAQRDPRNTTYPFGIVEHPDRFVHFSVSDQGSGIPKEMLQTVFEPLVTTKRNGTGLGLAVTHQIVVAHGGSVFADSAKGEGTTIHIFLPIDEDDSERIATEGRVEP